MLLYVIFLYKNKIFYASMAYEGFNLINSQTKIFLPYLLEVPAKNQNIQLLIHRQPKIKFFKLNHFKYVKRTLNLKKKFNALF